MKTLLLLFVLAALCLNVSSQITFEKKFSTSSSSAFTGGISNFNHNYVFTGNSGNAIILVEIDMQGHIIWAKNYQPPAPYNSGNGMSVIGTNDKGYLIAATIVSSTTAEDILLIKTDWQGNLQWNLKMGNSFRNDIISNYTVCQLSDSSYIVSALSSTGASISSYETYIGRVSKQGQIIWGNHFPQDNSQPDWGRDVIELPNGDIVVAGAVGIPTQPSILRIKADGSAVVWAKSWGIGTNSIFANIFLNNAGELIATGDIRNNSGVADIFWANISQNGQLNWHNLLNLSGEERDGRTIQLSDGSYAHCSNSTSLGNGNQFALTHLDNNGNILETRAFGGSGNELTRIVIKSLDNGLVMGGASDNQIYLVKTANFGSTGGCPYTSTAPFGLTYNLITSNYSITPTDPLYLYSVLSISTSNLALTETNVCENFVNCICPNN